MRVYHGTTPAQAQAFLREGIDGHLLHARAIHGPQDNVPGLFVTPIFKVARRFGLCIIEIEVQQSDLELPPTFEIAGASLTASLSNATEPQALLPRRIEPSSIKMVECHENGYPFNPYEGPDDPVQSLMYPSIPSK